jgi:TonB-dependent starch-binding outer membrane protein SusC
MPSKLTAARSWLVACLLLFTTISFAQQKTVTGKITGDKDKQPIFGATVTVKGSNIATQTGSDGTFRITVPGSNSILVVTFVGYEAMEVTVGDKTTVDIQMKDRSTTLTDVVVTGYSSQAKKDITGSVSVVKTEDLKSVPAANAESQLQGRAAGVTVTTSGRPGDAASVKIRGFGSFGSNQPYYIIDGIPAGGLGGLNPNDIESMQVLKDASAAAIYGVNGSSGVIVVTTKKGKPGTAKVSYNMYYGRQDPGKGFTQLLNSQEMADLTWLAHRNAGQAVPTQQYGTGANPRLPDYIIPSGAMEGDPLTNPSLYRLDVDGGNINQIVRANKQGTNWFNELTENAPIMNHNISLSGGADRSRFMFSFDYFDQKGIVIHNFYKRYTVRANTEFNVKKNIRIGENIQVLYSQDNQAGQNGEGTELGFAYRNQPIIPVYDIMGNFAGTRAQNTGNSANPVAGRIRGKDNRGHNFSIFGNMYAEVDLFNHFTARTSFGGDYWTYNWYAYTFKTYENSENNTGNNYTEEMGRGRGWTWTNQLTYKNRFGEHDITALVGTEAQEYWNRFINGSRVDYFVDNPDFRSLNSGGASGQRANGSPGTPVALSSYFGKVDYVYSDKYLASFAIRRDGSSRFGPENPYAVFPAGSIGWRISREAFMQDLRWVTDLKLKGSYGKLGNQRIANNNAFTTFAQGPGSSYYDINGNSTSTSQGFQQSFVGNPAGKWETNITTNIGFDASLFGGKTEVSFEWYKKTTEDLLFRLPQVASGGAAVLVNPAFFNVASMENTGIDLLITHRMNVGGANGIGLDITGTFTTYKNEITGLAENIDFFEFDNGERGRIGGVFTRNAVGHPVSAFYGYQVQGIFQSADEVSKSPVQDGKAPGRFRYLDVDGNDTINTEDRVFFGNPNPDFTYGLNINLSYKNFDLTAFFYGAQGKDAINYVKWWTDFYPSFQGAKSKAALYGSWSPTNTGATTPIAENASNFSNNNTPNSYYLEDASYLRLKNLSIGYTVPTKILNRVKVDRLRIYAQATNLFTITKYSGLDPEIIANGNGANDAGQGFDAGVYPTVKQFLIGVNLNF